MRKVRQGVKVIKAKEKVRGRGGEERRARTEVCRARSVGRGARGQQAVLGAWARSGRRPQFGALGVGPRGPGAWRGGGPGGGDGAAAAGEGCTGAGCARQGRQAPRSGAFVLCRGKQAAPAWRWPSTGASSGAPRARWIGHPRNRPTFSPPLSCRSPGPTLQARRREEARGLGRGKGPPGPRVLTPDSPRRPECGRTKSSLASGGTFRGGRMRCRGRRGEAGWKQSGAQVGELGGACTELRLWMESGHMLFLSVVTLSSPPQSLFPLL